MEEANGKILGEATADDVLYFARRMKVMKDKLLALKRDVDAIYEMRMKGFQRLNI